MPEQSEFGKGFIYNLLLFYAHFSSSEAKNISIYNFVMEMPLERKRKVLADNPESKYDYGWNRQAKFWFGKIVPIWDSSEKLALSEEIISWAGAAKDHLYELQIPECWKDHEIGRLAKELQEKAFAMGAFESEILWTYQDLLDLRELTHQLALSIDKELKVEICKTEWS